MLGLSQTTEAIQFHRPFAKRMDELIKVMVNMPEVQTDSPPPDLTRLEDRAGALGGSIVTERLASSTTGIRVELPCGS